MDKQKRFIKTTVLPMLLGEQVNHTVYWTEGQDYSLY